MANAKVTSGIVALVVTALLVGGVVYAKNANKTEDAAVNPAETTSQTTSTESNQEATITDPSATATEETASSTYQDGTYSASGTYSTPGGQESVIVSVTLKDNVVTATSATGSGKDRDSRQYQSRFINGYKTLVVGKKISDIQLSQVSGSSLTSSGFNKALDQIEQQAAA
ncbi:MAG: hypothetical protein WBP26_02015 [Candidatus Saccharimonadales bacterium]